MRLRALTAGESHGPALLAILEGLPAGLPVNEEIINEQLARRQKGYGSGPRMKLECDRAHLLGGVMEGLTTGAPLAISIDNLDHQKWKGKAVAAFTTPRPGHVDLAGVVKYGYADVRPALERASARETAARVAIGAVCKQLLAEFSMQLGGYVVSLGAITSDLDHLTYPDRFQKAEASDVRCPDETAAEQMRSLINQTMLAKDTLGGVIEVVCLGLPPGLGSHVHADRRLEAQIGAAILSVQAIKGVEIGPAFENTRLPGTMVHDSIRREGDNLVRLTDRSGGIEGGISTGQPLIIRAAMKPIATTIAPQRTVDLATGEEVDTRYERSDFCPVPRAVPVLEAVLAFVLANALLEKLGGDSLNELRPRYAQLRLAKLSDLKMINEPHIFWPSGDGDPTT